MLKVNDNSENSFMDELQNSNPQKDLSNIKKLYLSIIEFYNNSIYLLNNSKDIINKINALKNISQNNFVYINEEFCVEFISIMIKICEIEFKFIPRNTQIIALLLFLYKEPTIGVIENIFTGEGKSLIITLLATIKAFTGHKVDILTSSPILAERDAKSMKNFYNFFGISVDFCRENAYIDYKNECYEFYNADICYGDTLNFESDILRTDFMALIGRGNKRGFDCIIIDEIDNLCLDNIKNRTELIDTFKGYKYLDYLHLIIYEELIKIDNQYTGLSINEKKLLKNEIIDKLSKAYEEQIKKYPPKMKIQDHIKKEYIPYKLKKWFEYAFEAMYFYEKNKDYIIAYDNELKFKVIKPVDYYNTGIIEENSVWPGLHQFLQIKEHLRITEENFSSCYMSHLTFFNKYIKKNNKINYQNNSEIIENNIYGLTGTLGSEDSQKALKILYNLDLIFIPSFKKNQLNYDYQKNLVIENELDYKNKFFEIINKIAIDEERVILIIFKYIRDVESMEVFLSKNKQKLKNLKIIKYSRSDIISEREFLENEIDSKTVILSTNLSGRGTDIKLTRKVLDNGGLHVILTFMPISERVEKQAFGRAARKGEKGSAQYLIRSKNDFHFLIKQRDINEKNEYNYLTLVYQKKIFLFEYFFNSFSEKLKIIRKKEMDEDKKASIIRDIKERWSLFLVQNDLISIDKNYKDENSLKYTEEQFNESKKNFSIFIDKIIKDIENIENYSFVNKLLMLDTNDINILNNISSISLLGVTLKKIYNKLFEGNEDNTESIYKDYKLLKEECNSLINQIKSIMKNISHIRQKDSDLEKQFNEKLDYLNYLLALINENLQLLNNNLQKKAKVQLLPEIIDISKVKKITKDIYYYYSDLGIIHYKLKKFDNNICHIY